MSVVQFKDQVLKSQAVGCAALAVLENREPYYEAYASDWAEEVKKAFTVLKSLPPNLTRSIAISHFHRALDAESYITSTIY